MRLRDEDPPTRIVELCSHAYKWDYLEALKCSRWETEASLRLRKLSLSGVADSDRGRGRRRTGVPPACRSRRHIAHISIVFFTLCHLQCNFKRHRLSLLDHRLGAVSHQVLMSEDALRGRTVCDAMLTVTTPGVADADGERNSGADGDAIASPSRWLATSGW